MQAWLSWSERGTVKFTVFGKHCECIAQKCTHLERLPPLASHLLLPSHCVLTRHRGKKMENRKSCMDSGIRTPNITVQVHSSAELASQTDVNNGTYHSHMSTPIYLNIKISQLFAEDQKIRLTPKITNHLFTYYLNCTCKSNPICLIQQKSDIFLLASYVQ